MSEKVFVNGKKETPVKKVKLQDHGKRIADVVPQPKTEENR